MNLRSLMGVLTSPPAQYLLPGMDVTSIEIRDGKVVAHGTVDGKATSYELSTFDLHHRNNTGLPCDHCGLRQKAVATHWHGDELFVSISTKIGRRAVKSEVGGLVKLLRSLLDGA